jgi:hypothetical protein
MNPHVEHADLALQATPHFPTQLETIRGCFLWQDDLVSVALFIADCFDQSGGDPFNQP